MPIGFGSRCLACKSPKRAEIDRRLLAGESHRAVSRWLAEEGESISRESLRNHAIEHLSVADDIARRVEESRPEHEQAVVRGAARVQALERNVERAAEMRDLAADHLRRQIVEKGRCPGALVALFAGASAEVRQSIQAVQKALGETVEVADAPADPFFAHILANPELVARAHDILDAVCLDGDAGGPGLCPEPG